MRQHCRLKSASRELPVDVVEVRLIPQHFEQGCRLPAHGTVTIDVRSDHVWHALKEIARLREAVVLQQPDGRSLPMRFGTLMTTKTEKLTAGAPMRPTATFSWHAP